MRLSVMQNKFSTALVTGASSGIGEAVARLLAEQGINLILTGRNQDNLIRLAKELSPKVHVELLFADLRLPLERAKVVAVIRQQAPDLVINNAGLGLYGPALAYDTAEQLAILEVDGHALLELSLEAARALISFKKPGTILNVSSSAAFPVMPYFAVYSATKAFVNQFSEAFDAEVRPYGIRVLASCPGVVTTHFQQRAGGRENRPRGKIKPMTVEFAAEQIWKQIVSGKKVHVFDWHYRLMIFLVRYVLPKKWVERIVANDVIARGGKTDIKKIPHA